MAQGVKCATKPLMNYRHIFHAGNRCDVVKHVVLTLVLSHLCTKDKAFAVLDTHAGVGLYDLSDPRALKTNEAAQGIRALLSSPALPQLAYYYAILRKLNPLWDGKDPLKLRTYPGSPLVAFNGLREQDRVIACELHPDDAEALRICAPADSRLQIHRRDGFEAMGAFLPPQEKRGLVLIDPPYEQLDEFDVIVKNLREVHRRWPNGIYMIWYPIKDRPAIWQFHEALASSGIAKILCAEFIYETEAGADALIGSGLIFINPPWKLDEELEKLYPELHKAMLSADPKTQIKWLVE